MKLRNLIAWKGLLVLALILGLVGGAVSLAATFNQSPQVLAAEGSQINIKSYTFSPVTLKSPVGTKVVWTNQDKVAHTVTARDGSWGSQAIKPGESYSFTFTKEGVYYYFCEEHPWMWGRVIVGNPANVQNQGTTSDGTQWMLDHMGQVHGQGSIDAMREYMDKLYGEGAFDGMVQSMGQNGGSHCTGGAGAQGAGPGAFGSGMMGNGTAGGGMMGTGSGMMGNRIGR